MDWVAVLVAFVAAAALGALAPRVIAALPEPEPAEDTAADATPAEAQPAGGAGPTKPPKKKRRLPPPPAKVPYPDLARAPGLAAWLALASGAAAALMAIGTGWDWRLLPLVPLVPLLVALAWVDMRTHLLPSRLVYPALVVTGVLVGAAALLAQDLDILKRAALGGLAVYLVFEAIWWIMPIGYGDVRLAGLLGVALGQVGWDVLVTGIYGAFLLYGIVGTLLVVMKVINRRGSPFGPWLVLAAVLAVPLGGPLLDAVLASR